MAKRHRQFSARGPRVWEKIRRFTPVPPRGSLAEDISPQFRFNKNACKKLGGNPCASRLIFLGAEEAAALGTRPGPNLLYCQGENKPGKVVPVASAKDAVEKGNNYCDCRKEGGTAKDCDVVPSLAVRKLLSKKRKGKKARR